LTGRVLEYYAGVFDTVYVLLNPFERPATIPRERLLGGRPYPSQAQIRADCEPVTWETVRQLAGFPSLANVNVALQTYIGGLRKQYRRDDLLTQLEQAMAAHNLVPPGEGHFPPLMMSPVLQLFQEAGHHWLWAGDDLCTERKLYYIEDLKAPDRPSGSQELNIFAPDKSMLWSVHWDTHFTFLCSSAARFEQLDVASRLEGFFCTPDFDFEWGIS
jgi:hypothetical protein